MNAKKAERRLPAKPVATSGANIARYYPGKAPQLADDLSASESDVEATAYSDTETSSYKQTKPQFDNTPKLVIGTLTASIATQNRDSDKKLIQKRLEARRLKANSSSGESSSEEQSSSLSQESSSEDEGTSSRLNREQLRQKILSKQKQEQQTFESSEESSEAGSESSEYESDDIISTIQKPVFVAKSQRKSKIIQFNSQSNTEILKEEDYELELEKRREETLRLAALHVVQETETPAVEENMDMVDDTDGIDEEKEYEEWKIRELGRIKRDEDLRIAREENDEEVDRRRLMTDKQVLKEDRGYFEKQNQLKLDKKKLQQSTQNHHMGAFFNDILSEKNVVQKYAAEATVSTVEADLPEVLKAVRAKGYGKSSQTKWKGLKNEDTSYTDSRNDERIQEFNTVISLTSNAKLSMTNKVVTVKDVAGTLFRNIRDPRMVYDAELSGFNGH
ncbi:hypothetical protein BB561_004109 [Smittium simulii]|uniref:Micro-fibrillar-associated protein 1 C-terminal domain-containing protein n=1 Tax=Smittium simulii TaxID=133385 RepID=A0A2T9YI54_9FUNG|nr:hypothetical protein BB561_004109 [Smittium simulii]